MQLKIITRTATLRFNQQGEVIPVITEPFVHVEVYTREDVVALFDQGKEHLVNAFNYNGEEIAGVSDKAAESVQGFFQADGAWYLKQLHPAAEDNPEAATGDSAASNEIPCPETSCPPTVAAGPEIALITDPAQQTLLRNIQTLVQRLHHIKPEANEPWDRQVQRLLLSQQHFGVQDTAAAYQMGQEQLVTLVEQAKAAGIPANVIESNLSVACDSDADLGSETEEDEDLV